MMNSLKKLNVFGTFNNSFFLIYFEGATAFIFLLKEPIENKLSKSLT